MSKEFNPQELADAVTAVNVGFEEYKKINDLRIVEIEKKGSADPLLEDQLKSIDASLTLNQKRLDDFELSQKRQKRVVVDEKGNEIDMDAKALKWARSVSGDKHATLDDEGMIAYKSGFLNYLRKGDRAMGADELKALSVGTDPDGGYVVHPDMSGRITGFVRESTPMRAYASTQLISGSELEGLFDLDEASSGWVSEAGARTETDTPQLDKWRIPVHEVYAAPRATQRLLDDSEMNMEEWLAGKVASKFARDEATAFTTGNGVGKPRGFTTYSDWAAAGTFENGKIEQFDTGVNGAFAAAPNGGDALITALYGLKAQYRANATWFMNRATLTLTRKLKDSDGAYLWAPGIAAGQPSSILGYPLASFEDMADPATGSLSIAVGDMRETYQIVERQGVRTLRDPYSAKPYVIFYSTKRVGGDVINFDSLKLINFKS